MRNYMYYLQRVLNLPIHTPTLPLPSFSSRRSFSPKRRLRFLRETRLFPTWWHSEQMGLDWLRLPWKVLCLLEKKRGSERMYVYIYIRHCVQIILKLTLRTHDDDNKKQNSWDSYPLTPRQKETRAKKLANSSNDTTISKISFGGVLD